jgi:hypothetical protein
VPVRVAGVLLFLPVPLVLFLFTRAPLGVLVSLGVGVVLTLTHRLYARPWALSRAAGRCLWCGGSALVASPTGTQLSIEEPFGRSVWRACGEPHARSLRRVLGWAARRAPLLKLGILGTLAVFVAWGSAAGFGWLGPLAFGDAVAFFRLGIALTVLPLGWLAARATPAPVETLRAPFPLHVPALIGLWAVLWLFRLIGLVWLIQGGLHLAQRLGLAG